MTMEDRQVSDTGLVGIWSQFDLTADV